MNREPPPKRTEVRKPKVRARLMAEAPQKHLKFSPLAEIDEMADKIHENAHRHGFHDLNQSEGDFLAHMGMNKHGEISELYDAWRAGHLHGPCDKADKMIALGLPPLTCAEEEYADLVIRAFDECRRLGIDIAQAIAVKHAYNLTRPFKHGKLS